MRVLVTGATGFVGRWLLDDLRAAGHDALASGEGGHVDVTDGPAVRAEVRAVRPDAIAHLAGVSFGPDAARDPARAEMVNVGGTQNLMTAIESLTLAPVVLVSGSSEIYGVPDTGDLPLRETSPARPANPYGESKARQERVALEAASRSRLPLVMTRSFNHIGPGQRPVFAVPAIAARAIAAHDGHTDSIAIGNAEVRRDFTDVRDVVRAYRLLLEGLSSGAIPRGGFLVNVCSGEARSIRSIVELICAVLGIPARLRVDPTLVRANEAPEIVGDPAALRAATAWRPEIPFVTSIADIVDDAQRRGAASPEPTTAPS